MCISPKSRTINSEDELNKKIYDYIHERDLCKIIYEEPLLNMMIKANSNLLKSYINKFEDIVTIIADYAITTSWHSKFCDAYPEFYKLLVDEKKIKKIDILIRRGRLSKLLLCNLYFYVGVMVLDLASLRRKID